MNIFALSRKIKKCAEYHMDKHVVKMILEYIQLLCSAHIILDKTVSIKDYPLYKLTHKNHPCAIWVRESSSNYIWLYKLMTHLCDEYTFRYGKIHESCKKYRLLLHKLPKNIPRSPMTPFALAMPDEYKVADPIQSYRNYYIGSKQHIAKWTKRDVPYWYNLHI
jgi:hypothetical protein